MDCPTCGKPKMYVIAYELLEELERQGIVLVRVKADSNTVLRLDDGVAALRDFCDRKDQTY